MCCKLSIFLRRKKERKQSRLDQELRVAAVLNNLPEVSRLLSVGADVNAKDRYGNTPLHWSCFQMQVVNELLDHGADIEAKDYSGWTILHRACYRGRVTVVIELLSRGANIETKDNDGNTPLYLASREGYLPVVKALLSSGANIIAANNQGRLPIHEAVSRRYSAVAKSQLQNYYATIRRLPLHGLVEDLTWIGDPEKNDAPPLRAALHKYVLGTDDVVDILAYLIDRNPDLLASCDRDGSLPLHVACRRGISFAIIHFLVKHYQASIKSATPQGDLPLFLACEMSETSLDTIFLLMKQYPDLVIGGAVPAVGCRKYLP
jgi:ankyrin repeat protein